MRIRRRPVAISTPAVPEPVPSQDEQRQRRRAWLRVHYTANFDLAAEVSAIVTPLAEQAAALPRPVAVLPAVEDVADAVRELLSTVIGMLVESRSLAGTAHARTAQAARDLAQRPREPQVSDDMLVSGRWAAALVNHVAPHASDFAAYLGRALAPNDPRLSGPSASERLEAALRTLDSAALALQRTIPKVAAYQALPTIEEVNAANRARRDAERANRMLAKMGVSR